MATQIVVDFHNGACRVWWSLALGLVAFLPTCRPPRRGVTSGRRFFEARMSEIKIEKNVPMPTGCGLGLTDTLRKMKRGDSIVWPAAASISSIGGIARGAGIKYAQRRQPDGTVRVWCIEPATR